MMHEIQATEFRLSKLVFLSILSQIGFGLPIIALLIAIGVLNVEAGLFFLGIFLGIIGPTLGFLSWLIVKGSNGANSELALKPLFILPGRLYGVLLGGLVGGHFTNQFGGIVGAILCYFVGGYLGTIVATRLSKRLLIFGING